MALHSRSLQQQTLLLVWLSSCIVSHHFAHGTMQMTFLNAAFLCSLPAALRWCNTATEAVCQYVMSAPCRCSKAPLGQEAGATSAAVWITSSSCTAVLTGLLQVSSNGVLQCHACPAQAVRTAGKLPYTLLASNSLNPQVDDPELPMAAQVHRLRKQPKASLCMCCERTDAGAGCRQLTPHGWACIAQAAPQATLLMVSKPAPAYWLRLQGEKWLCMSQSRL